MRQPPALLSIIFPVIHFIANSLAGKQYYFKDCATASYLTQKGAMIAVSAKIANICSHPTVWFLLTSN